MFGQGVLNAWTYTSNPELVSLQLLNDIQFDVGSFMADRFGEWIGRAVAAQAMTGTGSSAPLGIIPALAAGASVGTVGSGSISPVGNGWVQLATAASVKTFQSPSGATELTQNVLSPATVFAMVSAVDPAYWPNSAFYLSPTQVNNMASVIDCQRQAAARLRPWPTGWPSGNAARIPGVRSAGNSRACCLHCRRPRVRRYGKRDGDAYRRPGTSILRLQERWADYLAVGFLGLPPFRHPV